MSIAHRKERAVTALRERIRQRQSQERGDFELTYARENTNLRSYEKWEYRNADPATPEILQFYNRYKGERCFIIGNGPSLNSHDLSLLEGEKVFAVNSFYYKTRETGFKPTFFVVEDLMVMKENYEQFIEYDVPYKFFPTEYKQYHPPAQNVFYFKMNHGFYQEGSPYHNLPRFSTDPLRGLYCGQSVTYINLQLAFFMGFSDVYLIGMDFNYIIPKEHKRNGNDIISTTDDPNHFHKDYFGEGKTWRDPKLERVLMNYKMAHVAFSAVGRRIFNATKGGMLEEFPRVDYDLLFPSQKRAIPDNAGPENIFEVAGATEREATLSKANKLMREGRYREAVEMNIALYKKTPISIYEKNAIFGARKLGLLGVKCIADIRF
ncbi:MAG: 6-hydroxymethylpterin diphosphokinase MptE-like protein [Nitrosomonas ureae]